MCNIRDVGLRFIAYDQSLILQNGGGYFERINANANDENSNGAKFGGVRCMN